jgi:hypothetical protein
VVIVLIALTMAEFVALDMAMLLASDIILYVELVLAGWAMSAVAFLNPTFGYRLTMLSSRIMSGGAAEEKPAQGTGEDI